MALCSLRCCTIAMPIFAVFVAFGISLAIDGRAWDGFAAWQIEDMPDLSGKVAIVTGPTVGGIGHESAKELARRGAHVVLAGRSEAKGGAALQELKTELPGAKAEFLKLDLASLQSVKEFATSFKAKHSQLHILLNNAGIMANPFTLTVDGLESQFATNHLGHFLLTKLLLPELEAAAPSRVVSTSSAAAWGADFMSFVPNWLFDEAPALDFEHFGEDYREHYGPNTAYVRSKLANVLFTKALAKQLAGKKIYVNSCNPGGIKTNLQVHAKTTMGSMAGDLFDSFLIAFGLPLRRGALTQLFLATSLDVEMGDIRGTYYQPQALHRGEPSFSKSEELQDKLWKASERLVAKYL